MLNGMRRKPMILESLKADQILTDACLPAGFGFRTWPLWRTTRMLKCMGKCWLFALKNALLGLVSYVHEPVVCHLPFHLIHSFKNLSLEKILLPKLTLKEKQKKNTERCPTPHFSLLKGHLTFENSPFLLSEGLSIGRAAHVCLGIRDFCAEEKCENC